MKRLNQLDSGLFRFVIAVFMMLMLIFFINKSYLNNKQTIDSVNFELEQQNFIKTLALVNGQWLLEGRPRSVDFSFHDQDNKLGHSRVFAMSTFGWPSLGVSPDANYCLRLWSAVINVDQAQAAQKIFSTTKFDKDDDIRCKICDVKQQDSCLTYSTKTGISIAY